MHISTHPMVFKKKDLNPPTITRSFNNKGVASAIQELIDDRLSFEDMFRMMAMYDPIRQNTTYKANQQTAFDNMKVAIKRYKLEISRIFIGSTRGGRNSCSQKDCIIVCFVIEHFSLVVFRCCQRSVSPPLIPFGKVLTDIGGLRSAASCPC